MDNNINRLGGLPARLGSWDPLLSRSLDNSRLFNPQNSWGSWERSSARAQGIPPLEVPINMQQFNQLNQLLDGLGPGLWDGRTLQLLNAQGVDPDLKGRLERQSQYGLLRLLEHFELSGNAEDDRTKLFLIQNAMYLNWSTRVDFSARDLKRFKDLLSVRFNELNNQSGIKSIEYQGHLMIKDVVLTTDEIVVAFNANGEKSIQSNQRVLCSLIKQSSQDVLTILTEFKPSGDGDDLNKLLILYAEFQNKVLQNDVELLHDKQIKEFDVQFLQKVHDVMKYNNNYIKDQTELNYKDTWLTASKNEGFFIRKKCSEGLLGIKIPADHSQGYARGLFTGDNTFIGSKPVVVAVGSLDQNNSSERCIRFYGFDSMSGTMKGTTTYSDGSQYTGGIKNFQPHGDGQITKITKDGTIVLKGRFDQGQPIKYHSQPIETLGVLSYTNPVNNRSKEIQIWNDFNDGTIKTISVSEVFEDKDLTHDDIDKIESLLKTSILEYILVSQKGRDGAICTIYPTEEFMKCMTVTGGRHPNTRQTDFNIIYLTKDNIEKLRQFLNGGLTTDEIVAAFNTNANGSFEHSIQINHRVLCSLIKQSSQDVLTILTEFKPSGDGDDFNKLLILYAEFHNKVSQNHVGLLHDKQIKEFDVQFLQKVHDVMKHNNNYIKDQTELNYKDTWLTVSKNEGFFIRKKCSKGLLGIKIPADHSQGYARGLFTGDNTFIGSKPLSVAVGSLDQNNSSERWFYFYVFDSMSGTMKGIITYYDGSQYKGTIQNFQPHGDGHIKKTTEDGTIELKGRFDQGQLIQDQGQPIKTLGVLYMNTVNNRSKEIQIWNDVNNGTIKEIFVSECLVLESLTHDDIDKIKSSLLENPMPEYILVSHTAGDGVICTIYPTEEFMKCMTVTDGHHPITKQTDFNIIYLTKDNIEKLRELVNSVV